MKIRHIIENDIVEDISIYKNIQSDFIDFIREMKLDYEPSFTLNEFCTMMINNFDEVDEDINDIEADGDKLTTRLFNSIMRIALYEFADDEEISEKLRRIIKENQ